MLDRLAQDGLGASKESETMAAGTGSGDDRNQAQAFRDAALPYLDDVYSVARYLLRDEDAASDAVQECYLRALRSYDTFRGPAMKPWLLAIVTNVCRIEFKRRKRFLRIPDGAMADEPSEDVVPLWQEAQPSPEAELLREHDTGTICRLVAELPQPFREVVVLREIHDLSYREIAEVLGAPVGTVMSRLARARAELRRAWLAEDKR